LQAEQSVKDHRQFWKKVSLEYKPGTFFPKELVLLSKTEPVAFDWLHQTVHGSILFFVSTTCSACNMESVKNFVDDYPHFTYCVFFEGNQEAMDIQREVYELDIPFYVCNVTKLQPQTQVNAIPYVVVLNKIGQAIAGDIFNSTENIRQTAHPLIQVYDRKRFNR
jgi:hypothetical protein